MRKYDIDERCTFYFIVYDDDDMKRIQAWTDKKEYAKIYMDFHRCRNYKMKSITKRFDDMMNILNENYHDEINLYNISVRNDKDHKKGKETKIITVPLTSTEQLLINDESVSFMASRVDYSFINEAFHYLKDKYQKVLKTIYLKDVMEKVIYEKQSLFTNAVQVDELMILFRSFPDHFGK